MKLALATALAFAPVAADSAVVLSFSGVSDAGAPVTGTITVDTAALPSNGAAVPGDTDYAGSASFLTVTFAGAGFGLPLGGGVGDNSAYADRAAFGAGGGFTLASETGSGTPGQVTASFQLYTLNPTPSALFGGVLLPDLRAVGGVFYALDRAGPAPFHSAGTIGSIGYAVTGTVPEAATWATMVAGLGLVGGALRQRRMPATA